MKQQTATSMFNVHCSMLGLTSLLNVVTSHPQLRGYCPYLMADQEGSLLVICTLMKQLVYIWLNQHFMRTARAILDPSDMIQPCHASATHIYKYSSHQSAQYVQR